MGGKIQKTCWKAEISTLPLSFANRDHSIQSFHPCSHSESHQATGHTRSASLSGLACAPASLPLFFIPSFLRLSDTQAWSSHKGTSPALGTPGHYWLRTETCKCPRGALKAFAEVGSLCFTRHSSTPQHSPFINHQSSSERCLSRLRLVFGLLG